MAERGHLRSVSDPAEPEIVGKPFHPRSNDPAKAVRLTVRGPRHEAMLDYAVAIAAKFLGEPGSYLYVSDAGTAHVHKRERFVPHLGIEPRPVSWELTCTIRLAPEIVQQRRSGHTPAEDDDECADHDEGDGED